MHYTWVMKEGQEDKCVSPFNSNATYKIDGAQRAHRKLSNEDGLKKKIMTTRNRISSRSRRHIDDAKANEDYENFKKALPIKNFLHYPTYQAI